MSKKRILLIGLLVVGMVVVGIEAAVLGLSRDTASEEASRVATRPLSGTADAVATGVEAAASGPEQSTAILPAAATAAAPAPAPHGINGAEPQGAPTLSQQADTTIQPDPNYKNVLTDEQSQPHLIRHVHWSDNYLYDTRGRNDSHANVGQGSLPIEMHRAIKGLDATLLLEHFYSIEELEEELEYIDRL